MFQIMGEIQKEVKFAPFFARFAQASWIKNTENTEHYPS